MRIPAPPPGFAVHGGALSCVSHGEAANGIGSASAAQGMATLHDAMQGLPGGHGPMGKAAQVGAAVSRALEGAGAHRDIQSVHITTSDLADSLAQTFAGERPCP